MARNPPMACGPRDGVASAVGPQPRGAQFLPGTPRTPMARNPPMACGPRDGVASAVAPQPGDHGLNQDSSRCRP